MSYRNKNNSRKISESNNEALHMSFDENRSSDFTHTELDIATGESYTISLVESHQPNYGNTKLVFRISYVDSSQHLHETEHTHYCPTLPGTITKRLQHYLEQFHQKVKELVSHYHTDSYKSNVQDKLTAFASYIYLNSRKHDKSFRNGGYTVVSEYGVKSSINKILVIFSAFNADCFKDDFWYKNFDLSQWPLEMREEDIRDFSISSLGENDSNQLDAIMEYLSIDYHTVQNIFKYCKTGHGGIDYDKFATNLRNTISIETMEVK